MKAIGYICTFLIITALAWLAATKAESHNIEFALFLGAMIPIVMFVAALANGDFD